MSVSPRPKSRQRPNCGCNSLAKSDEEKELKQAASSELCSSPGPRSSHSLQTSDSFTYEHFPIVCPTCRGSGKIPEGMYRCKFAKWHSVPVQFNSAQFYFTFHVNNTIYVMSTIQFMDWLNTDTINIKQCNLKQGIHDKSYDQR